MAQANKLGLVGYAVLKYLQSNLCSHCGETLNSPYQFPLTHGSIAIDNPEDYKTSIAHILAQSKGGKDTLSNYTLQHYYCNRAFYNFDYAEFASKSGSKLSFADVSDNAKRACELNSEILKGKLSIEEVRDHAKQAIAESSEFIRRYPRQVAILGLEAH